MLLVFQDSAEAFPIQSAPREMAFRVRGTEHPSRDGVPPSVLPDANTGELPPMGLVLSRFRAAFAREDCIGVSSLSSPFAVAPLLRFFAAFEVLARRNPQRFNAAIRWRL